MNRFLSFKVIDGGKEKKDDVTPSHTDKPNDDEAPAGEDAGPKSKKQKQVGKDNADGAPDSKAAGAKPKKKKQGADEDAEAPAQKKAKATHGTH